MVVSNKSPGDIGSIDIKKDVLIMNRRILSAALAFIICVTLAGCDFPVGSNKNETVKYTMYIGLNDKDTYTQLISYDEAEKKVSAIALKYVDGFTQLEAKGTYKDEKGVITHENSIVMVFSSVTDRQMKAIMDDVIKELNQNSVLLEKQTVDSEFYEGTNNDKQ